MFQSFICWSMAFEYVISNDNGYVNVGFNPLFVGVWLLNNIIKQVFYWRDNVSILYLLEYGF